MDYREFLRMVQREGALGDDEAERAARATLTTLAERLPPGQARGLLRELPAEMEPWLSTERAAERFSVTEFLRRVAEREGVDVDLAERHARAVFFALGRGVSRDEIAGVADELPQDFAPLVAEARRRFFAVMPAEEFLARVAERTGLDPDGARRVTVAVLEVLAERIDEEGADDLISRLPLALRDPLRHGRRGTAGRVTRERFLGRVVEIEGVDPSAATEHVLAVFSTLREAIGREAYFDVAARLPRDCDVLLPGP